MCFFVVQVISKYKIFKIGFDVLREKQRILDSKRPAEEKRTEDLTNEEVHKRYESRILRDTEMFAQFAQLAQRFKQAATALGQLCHRCVGSSKEPDCPRTQSPPSLVKPQKPRSADASHCTASNIAFSLIFRR